MLKISHNRVRQKKTSIFSISRIYVWQNNAQIKLNNQLLWTVLRVREKGALQEACCRVRRRLRKEAGNNTSVPRCAQAIVRAGGNNENELVI